MPDPTLTAALAEAYASSPSDVVILHTLELRHPAFKDDDGAPIGVRLVRDYQDLSAKLEASAPLNANEYVRFIAMGFDLELPPVDTAPVPEITVTIDNVSRELIKHLDAAVESAEKIEITYRPYLSNDLSGPQMDPPITLTLTQVEADVSRVVGRARMLDVGNKSFPAENYTSKRFPSLTR
ncbi:DUF1833 family protein [Bartonella queenslandensis]|uniref:DUF1833 family protein n=1 Tax=Bartonella queenslandensis TaxID=481138 RepID=UPI000309643B|nr:DUF1833 family protein [Bartonella queenslandensis]